MIEKSHDIFLENKEGLKEYDPGAVLREREFYPEIIVKDETGKERIADVDTLQIFKFLRENVKEGSLLDMGAGITHCHYMTGVADKISQFTALDISAKNNQLIKEFLDGVRGQGEQKLIQENDMKMLSRLAEALGTAEEFCINRKGEDLLKMLDEKSFYKGQRDIITADMIAQMEDLEDGKLVDYRKYDNIFFSFALYVNDKENLFQMFKALKERLNKNGRIIIVDAKNFHIDEEEKEDVIFSEDPIVLEKYGDAYDWTISDVEEAARAAGFNQIEAMEYEIKERLEEQKNFGGYLFLKIEE